MDAGRFQPQQLEVNGDLMTNSGRPAEIMFVKSKCLRRLVVWSYDLASRGLWIETKVSNSDYSKIHVQIYMLKNNYELCGEGK